MLKTRNSRCLIDLLMDVENKGAESYVMFSGQLRMSGPTSMVNQS